MFVMISLHLNHAHLLLHHFCSAGGCRPAFCSVSFSAGRGCIRAAARPPRGGGGAGVRPAHGACVTPSTNPTGAADGLVAQGAAVTPIGVPPGLIILGAWVSEGFRSG